MKPTTPLDTLQAEAVELRGLIQQTNSALSKLRDDHESLAAFVATPKKRWWRRKVANAR